MLYPVSFAGSALLFSQNASAFGIPSDPSPGLRSEVSSLTHQTLSS